MTDWKFVITTTDGEPLTELRNARGRRLNWPRDGAATASFAIDGDDPAGYEIEELRTDLLAIRDGVKLFRGRIGGTTDQFTGTRHTISVTATDYRGLLEQRRRVQTPLTYTADTKWEIVSALLAHTQSQTGGDIGITMGPVVAGATHDRAYEVDKEIGVAIAELGRSATEAYRFEWWIDPDLVLRMGAPTRGVLRDFVAVYGETVGAGTRTVDPTQYANVVAGSGDADTTTRYVAAASDLASRAEGRFEAVYGDQDIKVQDTLEEHTDAQLVAREVILPSYTFQITKGTHWDPEVLWVGDTCGLVIRAGCRDIDIVERVEELSIDIGENGAETVTPAWGTARRDDQTAKLRMLSSRLDNLERR